MWILAVLTASWAKRALSLAVWMAQETEVRGGFVEDIVRDAIMLIVNFAAGMVTAMTANTICIHAISARSTIDIVTVGAADLLVRSVSERKVSLGMDTVESWPPSLGPMAIYTGRGIEPHVNRLLRVGVIGEMTQGTEPIFHRCVVQLCWNPCLAVVA